MQTTDSKSDVARPRHSVGRLVRVSDLQHGDRIECAGEAMEYRGYAMKRGSKLRQLKCYRKDAVLPVIWWLYPHNKVRRLSCA